MKVSDAVQRRVSIRAFKPEVPPAAVVRTLLERAARAPSGGNLQPWHVHALAGEPLAAIVLFGLGLRKFSMNASNIAHVKRTLSLFTLAETEEIAEKVMNMDTQADVEAFLKAEVAKREQKQAMAAKK